MAQCGPPCSPRSARPCASTTSRAGRLSASRDVTLARLRHTRATRPSRASDRVESAAAPRCRAPAGGQADGRASVWERTPRKPRKERNSICDHAAGKIVVERQLRRALREFRCRNLRLIRRPRLAPGQRMQRGAAPRVKRPGACFALPIPAAQFAAADQAGLAGRSCSSSIPAGRGWSEIAAR